MRPVDHCQEGVDPLGLPGERGLRGRIVEKHDAQIAVHELLQTAGDRVGLSARLVVDAAKQRLAKVREQAAGEAADEALRADDSECRFVDLAGGPVAIEYANACFFEYCDELVGPPDIPVVVPEHGEDRYRERPTGVCEYAGLLDLAGRRKVAGEEDDVGFELHLRECRHDPFPHGLGGVDIARCRDADHRSDVAPADEKETH